MLDLIRSREQLSEGNKTLFCCSNFLFPDLHSLHGPDFLCRGGGLLLKCTSPLIPWCRIVKHKIMYWGKASRHPSQQTSRETEKHCIFRVKCNIMTIALKWINLATPAQLHGIQSSNHSQLWCGTFLPDVISFYPLGKWQWGQKDAGDTHRVFLQSPFYCVNNSQLC